MKSLLGIIIQVPILLSALAIVSFQHTPAQALERKARFISLDQFRGNLRDYSTQLRSAASEGVQPFRVCRDHQEEGFYLGRKIVNGSPKAIFLKQLDAGSFELAQGAVLSVLADNQDEFHAALKGQDIVEPKGLSDIDLKLDLKKNRLMVSSKKTEHFTCTRTTSKTLQDYSDVESKSVQVFWECSHPKDEVKYLLTKNAKGKPALWWMSGQELFPFELEHINLEKGSLKSTVTHNQPGFSKKTHFEMSNGRLVEEIREEYLGIACAKN